MERELRVKARIVVWCEDASVVVGGAIMEGRASWFSDPLAASVSASDAALEELPRARLLRMADGPVREWLPIRVREDGSADVIFSSGFVAYPMFFVNPLFYRDEVFFTNSPEGMWFELWGDPLEREVLRFVVIGGTDGLMVLRSLRSREFPQGTAWQAGGSITAGTSKEEEAFDDVWDVQLVVPAK